MKTVNSQFVRPTKDEIASYAYYLWEIEGRQPGRELEYWLESEAHLIADRQHNAGLLMPNNKLDNVSVSTPEISKRQKRRTERA